MRAAGAAVLAVVLAGAAVTASCSSEPATDGPMQLPPGSDSVVCGPLPQYADASFGVNLPDDLPDGVTIEDVEPVGADGVSLGKSYLMPVSGYRLMLDTFPPTEQFADAWVYATNAIGATVATDTPVDLVVQVKSDGTDGTLDGLDITYSVNGNRYRAQSYLALQLRSAGCS